MIECSCGKGFYKWDLALAHMNETGHTHIVFDDEKSLERYIEEKKYLDCLNLLIELRKTFTFEELAERLEMWAQLKHLPLPTPSGLSLDPGFIEQREAAVLVKIEKKYAPQEQVGATTTQR